MIEKKQRILYAVLILVVLVISALRMFDAAIKELFAATMNISPTLFYIFLGSFCVAVVGFVVYALIETRTLREDTGKKIPSSIRILLAIPILAGIILFISVIVLSFIATQNRF